MKQISGFVLLGIVAAAAGLFVSDLFGCFFNGMDYGSASVLGFCAYLCVVVVTCTGVIVSRLDRDRRNKDEQDKDVRSGGPDGE